MNRYDPWVHHAVAHVMETQGRLEEGIAWMESLGHLGKLHSCTHNWWHIALYYLEKKRFRKCWNSMTLTSGVLEKESSKDQVGAISLLLRLG